MEAPPLERKLVAILAADVEGYSRLMGVDEQATQATLSAHRAITDALIARHGGRIAGTAGDSLLAEFGSIFAAVQCAVEIQDALEEANRPLPDDRRMRFRIGLNIGDVMLKDGDIFGDGVNIAARLQALAEPGGICVSRGVRDHIRRKLPYGFEDLGEKVAKNIARPIRVFRLLPEGAAEAGATANGAADLSAEPAVADSVPTASDLQLVELAFWDTIKDSTRAADFAAYLERYPEGNFAVLARARVEEFAAEPNGPRDKQDREVELAFWDSVRDSTTPDALRAYLDKYPEGEFKALAEIRLSELRSANAAGTSS